MPVSSYNTNPALNTAISGIDISEGAAAAGYNNALRQIMADIKAWSDAFAVAYPISIANGGTGQTTANAAFTAIAAAGGSVGAEIKHTGGGQFVFWGSSSMTGSGGGRIYIQPLGSDPSTEPGDIVFEY